MSEFQTPETISQLVFISNSVAPKYGDPLKKDWNDFQHLCTQARYASAKISPGHQHHRKKLASAKRQLYNPKLPTIRHMERDDTMCRLPEEHCRHTTSFTEEQFQKYDPTLEEPVFELTGLDWHDAGKILMGKEVLAPSQRGPSPVFGIRLRADKSKQDTQTAQAHLYRSPSLSSLSPPSTLTKPIKYSYRNYGSGTFDQSTKHNMWPRFHMNTRNSFDSINRVPMPKGMENIFRSSSMHVGVSSVPWKPAGPIDKSDGSNTARV